MKFAEIKEKYPLTWQAIIDMASDEILTYHTGPVADFDVPADFDIAAIEAGITPLAKLTVGDAAKLAGNTDVVVDGYYTEILADNLLTFMACPEGGIAESFIAVYPALKPLDDLLAWLFDGEGMDCEAAFGPHKDFFNS